MEQLKCHFCGRSHVTLKAVRGPALVNLKSLKKSKGKLVGYACENCSRIHGGR